VNAVDPRRHIPRTDAVLADPRLAAPIAELGNVVVKRTVVAAQQAIRDGHLAPEELFDAIATGLTSHHGNLHTVLNATGIVLHTNLGRAPLSSGAIEAVTAAAGYVDVEFDLQSGARARRGRGALAALSRAVLEADDVLVVNNGAAALLLATSALASGREVVVSRGEMVEIGDGFRLPDLIESGGARIREVGMTNRTRLSDYTDAVGSATGCILKVHPSNFVVSGFTGQVGVDELAALDVPLVVDVGSGLLHPDPLLPREPTVDSALRDGAHIVTCSGDKLLGGPQAGLIFGTTEAIQQLRRSPMARALRVDKLTLAALEATLTGPASPTVRYLHSDSEGLRQRCEHLAHEIGPPARVLPSTGAVGGGGAPGVELVSWAVALPEVCAQALRATNPPVIGRLERGSCLLDLRCIEPADEPRLLAAVRSVLP
jgi:L-seryl-tRNA(Ser) seleniumtransferase